MGILTALRKKSNEASPDDLPPYSPAPQNVRIKMLTDQRGASDGIHVEFFRQGQTYTVSENLARLFVEMGAAEYA